MCQVGMRYVVCRAQGRFLENVTLVYIQQIFNLFFCFFSPWNSIDVLIWKDKFKMYFKTFFNWTPHPEIYFWESRLFSDFKIKAQTLLFQQSRRFLSQLGWVCTSFHRFLCVDVCLKIFFMVLLSTSVFCSECQSVLKYLLNFVQLEGLPIAPMLKCMEEFTDQGWHSLCF